MSRRTSRGELEFGSDSFLDVVCNIVGILIILIVVVGVRVQRQPPQQQITSAPSPPVTADQAQLERDAAARERSQAAALNHASSRRDDLIRSQQQLQQESSQLQNDFKLALAEAAAIEKEMADVRRQQAERDAADQEHLSRRSRQLAGERTAIQARIASLTKSLDSTDSQKRSLDAALVSVQGKQQEKKKSHQGALVETQRLEELLEELTPKTQPANRLEHRLSPVTRAVEADEYHFRLENGYVSRIPLNELLERLKAQVLSRRAAVLKFNQFDGVVGPVGGYSMKYSVEKEGPSPLEALQTGDGRIRVNVSRWEIVREETRIEETVEAAVQPGARFREQLETCPPDAVVTLWVYEDSFAGFPLIRELAHSLSLRIAARPLPPGSPIIGSPNGSRSTAQ
ncbi:MAG: hypothetical protein ACKO2L_04465 [Planctomycetaceae bacterium]